MYQAISRRQFISYAAASSALPALAAVDEMPASSLVFPLKARLEPVTDRYWGVDVVDPYRWMEALPKTQEWQSWLKQQSLVARQSLDALPRRAELLKRLEFFGADSDLMDRVFTAGGRLFIYKRLGGTQQFELFTRDKIDGPERLILSASSFRKADGAPATFDYILLSPKGTHLAFGVSIGGSEITTTYIKNIATDENIEITKILSRGSGWSADGSAFFYFRIRADAVPGTVDYGKGASCWMHKIGSAPANDVEVFREGEGPDFEVMEDDGPRVRGAIGSEWLLGMHHLNGNDIALLYITRASDLFAGRPQWRKIAGRSAGMIDAHMVGNTVYVLAKGRHSNGELVKLNASSGTFANGTVVLSSEDGVIDSMQFARDGVYVHDLTRGLGGLRRVSFADKVERVPLP